MRILLVEDDARLLGTLTSGLSEEGFRVEGAVEAREARLKLELCSFDVIVLDVMLPDGNGFDLCRAIRSRGVTTPVLFLTAQGTEEDRVEGLTRGGDDYLSKPFSYRELVARVRALGRRPLGWMREQYTIEDLSVDLASRTVARAGRTVELTSQEWALLEFFVRNQNRVVSRSEITAYVWDENHDPLANLLEVLIWRLRRKLDEGFQPKLIHTVRGSGYRFGA
jgi:two-component system copper resistance phosphate regulon response regulator CusR